MSSRILVSALGVITLGIATPAAAQSGGVRPKSDVAATSRPSSGGSRTLMSEADARRAALAKVPGGKVEALAIREQQGRLYYAYSVSAPGAKGASEVMIDAMTANPSATPPNAGAPSAFKGNGPTKGKNPPLKSKPGPTRSDSARRPPAP